VARTVEIGDKVVDLNHGVVGEILEIEGDFALFAISGSGIVRSISLDDVIRVEDYEEDDI
jgi:hypothetical protein